MWSSLILLLCVHERGCLTGLSAIVGALVGAKAGLDVSLVSCDS